MEMYTHASKHKHTHLTLTHTREGEEKKEREGILHPQLLFLLGESPFTTKLTDAQ